MSFLVTKQANGVYRWRGSASNNALDRDREIVSKQALELDVYRTKTYGDTSELWFYHIPYALGGAPDFRAVVDGVLIESGEFYDSPVSKAFAEYLMKYEGDLGMSHGFYGVVDGSGTYPVIQMKERSALPLNKAANPYTFFEVEEVQKMALTKDQRAALAEMASDPEFAEHAQLVMAAATQSKALDAAGVTRKATSEPQDIAAIVRAELQKALGTKDVAAPAAGATQYSSGPGGLSSDPGVAKAAPAACANCGHNKAAHDGGDCTTAGCDCGGFASAKSVTPDIDDETAKGIALFVQKSVEEAKVELAAAVNEALLPLVEAVKALSQRQDGMENTEKAIQDVYEKPRHLATFERLKAMSATASDATILQEGDPLQAKAGTADDFFAAAGFAAGSN